MSDFISSFSAEDSEGSLSHDWTAWLRFRPELAACLRVSPETRLASLRAHLG